MYRSVNMRDVAKRAGVSAAAVSRVLSNRMGHTRISDATRQRILDAVDALNYVPNIHAHRLFSRRSGVLAVVAPKADDPREGVFDDERLIQLFNGIEHVISAHGYRIMIITQDRRFIEDKEYLGLFRSRQVDGVFIWGARHENEFYAELAPNRFPHLFLLTRPAAARDDQAFAGFDSVAASRAVMGHLLEKGHRRFLWTVPAEHPTSQWDDLEAGIRQALSVHGLTWKKAMRPQTVGYTYAEGLEFAEAFLRERPDATAVLTIGHGTAAGLADGLVKHGLRLPEDYAIACCDSKLSEMSNLRVTRCISDVYELGRIAAEWLLEHIDGNDMAPPPLMAMPFQPGETT